MTVAVHPQLRTIRHAAFAFRVPVPDPIRVGETILKERKAFQGETVEIPLQADLDLGDRLGAFVSVATPAATLDDGLEDVLISDMSDEDLVTWIKEDKPKVQEVIDAAGGDREQARRLLDAEQAATGGDTRKGVFEGLTAIIANT